MVRPCGKGVLIFYHSGGRQLIIGTLSFEENGKMWEYFPNKGRAFAYLIFVISFTQAFCALEIFYSKRVKTV